MYEDFVRALQFTPAWAMHMAFNEWINTQTRRPCPAEIVRLAQSYIAQIAKEIALRKKEDVEREEAHRAATRVRVTAEQAAEIRREVGYPPLRVSEDLGVHAATEVKEDRGWQRLALDGAVGDMQAGDQNS